MADPPTIPGHQILRLLGEGSTGETFLARDGEGKLVAAKFFKSMAVNRRLLTASINRLADAGPHPHVVNCLAHDFEARPAWMVMDYHGEPSADHPAPWMLEYWLSNQLEADAAWSVVHQVAEGLAHLHRQGVPHANLHPRNVLVTDPEAGTVAVSDYSQGWVGGIYHLEPNDALFYAPPEQLLDPEGMEQGGWGGWDVFAFGMLAFRLLTGRFAYAHDRRITLENAWRMDPAANPLRPAELAADLSSAPAFRWGRDAADWEEEERRRIIEACLCVSEEDRFADMREVVSEFSNIDEERKIREERTRVLSMRRREARALGLARAAAGLATAGLAAAAIAALVFANKHRQASGQRDDLQRQLDALQDRYARHLSALKEEARDVTQQALAEAEGAERATSAMRETLVRSQEQADRLFAIIRDRKPPHHPGFRDLAQTSAELSRFYEDFYHRVEGDRTMLLERARAADNLADLADVRDEEKVSAEWRQKAILAWRELVRQDPADPDRRQRLAAALLKRAQYDLDEGRTEAASGYTAEGRTLLEELLEKKPGDQDLLRQIATAFFQAGGLARHEGRSGDAFDLTSRATEILTRLTEHTGRLDFRSQLAAGYVDLGEIARGMQDFDQAESVQRSVISQLLALVEDYPDLEVPRFNLARAHGELGEIECEGGELEAGINHLQQALQILEGLIKVSPQKPAFLFQKARRLASLARYRRDQGKGAEAERLVEESNSLLTRLVEDHPDNALYAYQLSLGEWQMAELVSDLGKLEEAMQSMHRALNRLDALLVEEPPRQVGRKQVQVSMAYLVGDLAHRLDQAKRADEAAAAFREAERRWKEIAGTYGEDDATLDGLSWCRRRIAELEAP